MIMIKESSDRLTTEEREELPSSDFGLPETREFPMPDGVHVRAAEAYFRYAPEDKKPFWLTVSWKRHGSLVWI